MQPGPSAWFRPVPGHNGALLRRRLEAAALSSCSIPLPLPPASLTWREAPDTDPAKTIAGPRPGPIARLSKNRQLAHRLPVAPSNPPPVLCGVGMKQPGFLVNFPQWPQAGCQSPLWLAGHRRAGPSVSPERPGSLPAPALSEGVCASFSLGGADAREPPKASAASPINDSA